MRVAVLHFGSGRLSKALTRSWISGVVSIRLSPEARLKDLLLLLDGVDQVISCLALNGPLQDRVLRWKGSQVITEQGHRLSAFGQLVLAVRILGAKFVHISTDALLTEQDTDPPKPSRDTVAEWMAERLIMSTLEKYVIVRTGRLFGLWPEREIESLASGRLKQASPERMIYTCAECFVMSLREVGGIHVAPNPVGVYEVLSPGPTVVHVSQYPPISAAELSGVPAEGKTPPWELPFLPSLGYNLGHPRPCYEKLVRRYQAGSEAPGPGVLSHLSPTGHGDPPHNLP